MSKFESHEEMVQWAEHFCRCLEDNGTDLVHQMVSTLSSFPNAHDGLKQIVEMRDRINKRQAEAPAP
jgi:hypothetical protein